MEISDTLSVLFRWLHVAAGILWIGLLYWFNFVNIPFAPTMDGDTKKKVVPELMPRGLYWFRWAAAYTWVSGVVLLFFVFYHGGLMYAQGSIQEWSIGNSLLTLAVIVVLVYVYDFLAKSPLGKNLKTMGVIGFILIGVVVYGFINVGSFDYRAYVIHTGALFGSIMAFNVWYRIYPSQKKIIAAVKEGTAPDAALVALAGARSRHNTFLSVPLVWTMINAHTAVPAANSWLYLLAAVLIGWLAVYLVYGKSGKIKGF